MPIEVERVRNDHRVIVNRVQYPQYPYDHFLFIQLPDGRIFVFRDESADFFICELRHEWTSNFYEKSFETIDKAIDGRLTRV